MYCIVFEDKAYEYAATKSIEPWAATKNAALH